MWLLRRLTNDPNLVLVEAPVLAPSELQLEPEHYAQIEAETRQAAEMALPEEDEDFWAAWLWSAPLLSNVVIYCLLNTLSTHFDTVQ